RFLEMRRKGASLSEGVRVAHRETWLPTLTAGCAAAASYGSLLVTDFRGFRDFGLIGMVGMVLCWIATYAALPCILTVIERLVPIDVAPASHAAASEKAPAGFAPPPLGYPPGHELPAPSLASRLRRATKDGLAFGKPFAALVPLAPRAITIVGVLLAVAGAAATVV